MKSKELDVSLSDFIDLVEISTNSNKIHLDYKDYYSYCRKIGMSSYILNLIINRTRSAKSHQSDIIDNSFFIIDKNIQTQEQRDKDRQSIKSLNETVSKLRRQLSNRDKRIADLSLNLEETRREKRRRIWPYWIVIVILFSSMVTLLYVILSDSQLKHELYILLPFI